MFEVLSEGGIIEMELQETFFSPLYSKFADKFGVMWPKNGEIFLINPNDILSIFTENQKILARCIHGSYKLKNRLYELEENPPNEFFIRISNSEIVNFSKVSSLDMSITGSITLKFINGEKTFVSRRYVGKIKKFLGA